MKHRKQNEDTPNKIFIFLITLGVSIMLYPIISNYFYTNKYNKTISSYKNISQEENKKTKQLLLENAKKYNDELSGIKVKDIFKEKEENISDDYKNVLNVTGDGMMGYIEIPKLDVKLPIFHGTSDYVLSKGVGHLEGTSLPVGGNTTHSVLSAHRGMPSSKLFTDLNQMVEGDVFYIYILDQILAYQVDKISVIEPTDFSQLQLEEGKDYITLLTCTPYGINTHRLLVRGKRISYSEEYAKEVAKSEIFSISDIIFYIGLIYVILLIIIDIILKTKLFFKKEIIINRTK